MKNILLICLGNTTRNDDGLGWHFGKRIEDENFPELIIRYQHQLQIEDTELLANASTAFIADASEEFFEDGFQIKKINSNKNGNIFSHKISPEALVQLTEKMYHKKPIVYTIAITGNNWEFGENISDESKKNLTNAVEAFKMFLKK